MCLSVVYSCILTKYTFGTLRVRQRTLRRLMARGSGSTGRFVVARPREPECDRQELTAPQGASSAGSYARYMLSILYYDPTCSYDRPYGRYRLAARRPAPGSRAHRPTHASALPGASRAAMRANIAAVGSSEVEDDVGILICASASAHGRSTARSWAWRAGQARPDETRKGQRSGSAPWNWGLRGAQGRGRWARRERSPLHA